MSSKITVILAVIITAALTFFLTREFSAGYEVVGKKSDTTTTVTTTIKGTENTFTAEQVGNIKKVLIDSLQTIYKRNINSLMDGGKWKTEVTAEKDSTTGKQFAYVSEIDSNFAAVDDSGKVTDSLKITSTFISPEPLPENSLHFLMIKHKSFTKEIIKEIIITNTETVREKGLELSPAVGFGYGVINKNFDVYAGVSLRYKFDLISILTGG